MINKITTIVLLFGFVTFNLVADETKVLKIHCGSTMIKPIKKMASIFEGLHNCKVKIKKGGSQDLYDSLKFLKNIDLYLPGSNSYLKKHKKDNFFVKSEYIGYNQAAIFVQKSNPKNINSLKSLLDKNIKSILCDPNSGSIGKNTKKVLLKYENIKFYNDAYEHSSYLGTDSITLNKFLKQNKVDMSINWRATAFFKDNKKYIDIVDIDEKYAPKKDLMLTLLSFSPERELADEFIKFATSMQGREIMKEYGFL
jgi:molybdate transport system substrate-binding protein